MKKIAIACLLGLSVVGCDIDREPYGSMSAERIKGAPEESLSYLMNGVYDQMKWWSDPMHRCGEYAGDNMMIRGSSSDSFYEFISFARTADNGRLQQFWDASYKAIAQTSNIINMIPEKAGEVNQQLGQCYYVRGLMYFYLVRAYGRPYYQSPTTNLGVPVVNGTPENTGDLALPDRVTVAENYERIIADLKKAEELLGEGSSPVYATKGAAQAMLSRVYLYMSGTYESPNAQYAQLAVDYATKVINSGKYSLLSRNDFMLYNTLRPEQNKESISVVKRVASEFSGYDHYFGIGGMYANVGGMGWGEMFASAKYLALLDEEGRNDWRPTSRKIVDARANFIEPQYVKNAAGEYRPVFRFIKEDSPTQLNYLQLDVVQNNSSGVVCRETVNNAAQDYTLSAVDAAQGIYNISYRDGKTYKGVLDNYIKLNRVYPEFYITKCSREGENSHLHSPVLMRLGEVYLNRAEALAKLGRYSEALVDLNMIRERSIPGKGYPSLSATDAPDRIDKERQLELAYQAERSYDVFRNGKALERRFPGPHNQFNDIPATDYRVVYYIPQGAINAYPGKLTQNPNK